MTNAPDLESFIRRGGAKRSTIAINSWIGSATTGEIAPVLRGRALEIVDAQGRIRAEIIVYDSVKMDGKMYSETVLLRLSDPKSGPVVKLTASAKGSALGLSDDAEGGVQLHALRDKGNFLKVVNRNRREQVIKP